MKVLHVVPNLSAQAGGVETSVRGLCLELSRIGIETTLCTTFRGYETQREGPQDDALRAGGVELLRFPVHLSSWFGQRYSYSSALKRYLREVIPRFDLVHIHTLWVYPTFSASRICQQRGVPYILSPCGMLDPYGFKQHPCYKRIYGRLIERKTFLHSEAIHYTSSMEQARARTFGILRPSAVIPRFARLGSIPEIPKGTFRRRHPEVSNRHLLLFLGRLHAKKRLDILVKAFGEASQRRKDLHLVIAGPDDGEEAQTRSRVQKTGLSDRVTFAGLLSGNEKWAALKESSLFLLPSEDENFGVAALEACAASLPVLLSENVAIKEEIRQAQAGLILPQNPSAWAAAICRLLDHPEEQERMGQAGKRLAFERFSPEKVIPAMLDLYRTALASSSERKNRG